MKVMYSFFITIFTLFSGAAYTYAAPATVSVTLETSRTDISVGDSLTVFCTLTSLSDIQVRSIGIDQSSNSFDIEHQWTVPPSPQQKPGETTIGFLLYAFAPDTLRIGPITASYQTADGDSGTAVSNTLLLPVITALDSTSLQPKPDRMPFMIQSQGVPFWLIILVFLAAAVIAFLIYQRLRKSKAENPMPSAPVDELGEFERIRQLHLLEDGKVKEHYLELSLALRSFIHRNMDFDARTETTEEIYQHLARLEYDGTLKQEISCILQESDMVKYAKYQPPMEISSTAIDRTLHPVKAVLDEIENQKLEEMTASEDTIISSDTVANTDIPTVDTKGKQEE